VSAQRFSLKPMNAEFVLLIDTMRPARQSAESICDAILAQEREALISHREGSGEGESPLSLSRADR